MRRRPPSLRSTLVAAAVVAGLLLSSSVLALSGRTSAKGPGARRADAKRAVLAEAAAKRVRGVRDLGLPLPAVETPKGKQCVGWPRQACTFNVVFERYVNVASPTGDRRGEYGFIVDTGGDASFAPAATSNGSIGHYASLDTGDFRIVDQVVATHAVGCGEALTVPLTVFSDERDNFTFGAGSEQGETMQALVLTCEPKTQAKSHVVRVKLENNFGAVRHEVDAHFRTEVVNPAVACAPAPVDADVDGGYCDIDLALQTFFHSTASEGNESGMFRFQVSAGAGYETMPPGDAWFFIDQGDTDAPADPHVARHRVPCGERRTVPLWIKGFEKDPHGPDDVGEATGSIEISCPMAAKTAQLPVTLYGNVSGKARHYVTATFTARDTAWSEFNADGMNDCCQLARCKSECPVIGTYDGANCLVATAPPPPSQPFLWSADPYTEGLYYTPGPGNQCTVGSWDTANCHVASVPTALATPFIHHRNLYVGACDAACPNACPRIGTWDGAHCFVGGVPDGGHAFIFGDGFYYTPLGTNPATACPTGTWDGANCRVATIPSGTRPAIWQNAFYVDGCRP